MREPAKPAPKDLRQLIGECGLFRGLPQEARAELTARARLRQYARGETIFLRGAEGDCLMAILSGRVRISVTSAEGGEMVLALLGPGEILGEIAMLDGKERTADATAQTACTLAILDRRDVLSLLQREPAAWPSIVELLCARLRNTDRHIAEIALLDLPARLANALLRVIGEDAAKAKPQVKLSQRALGEMVGASRESVNKCLAQWQRTGIVQVEGTTITVANKSALQDVAEPE